MSRSLKEVCDALKIEGEYFGAIRAAEKNKFDAYIRGSTTEHSTFLAWYLISNAKRKIKIVTSSLEHGAYKQRMVREALLEKSEKWLIKIEIVLLSKPTEKAFLEKLMQSPRVSVRVVHAERRMEGFMVIDDKRLRIDSAAGAGAVNFSNPPMVRRLLGTLDELKKQKGVKEVNA